MASSTLNELLEDFNARVAANMIYPKVKYYEQAFLQTKDELTFPMVNKGNLTGHQISLNDAYALQTYHRVLSSNTETDWSGGKGKYPYRFRVYEIRNVWLGNLKRLPKKPYHTIDDVKTEIYNALPVILTNKELIKTNEESANTLTVLEEEFAGHNWGNLTLDIIAFYIDYEIRQRIKCN